MRWNSLGMGNSSRYNCCIGGNVMSVLHKVVYLPPLLSTRQTLTWIATKDPPRSAIKVHLRIHRNLWCRDNIMHVCSGLQLIQCQWQHRPLCKAWKAMMMSYVLRLTTENVTFFSPPHLEPTRTLKDLIDAPLSSFHPCLSLYLSLCKLGKLFMLH